VGEIPASAGPLMTNPAQAADCGAEMILRSRLVLQLALEASLEKSRKALLVLDLAGLVLETQKQILLSRSLAVVNASRGSADQAGQQLAGTSGDLISPEIVAQLRTSALRIQSATRLHLALLGRSRQKLRVMANMLAGPDAPYSCVADQRLRGGLRA
jgi:hypothetical protein